MRTKIYCDACKNKFGTCIEIVKIITKDTGEKKRVNQHKNIRMKDIHKCELYAVYYAIKIADFGSEIFSDSQNIVELIHRKRKMKQFPEDFVEEIRNLMLEKDCSLTWIERDKNLAGKVLERSLINSKKKRSLKKFGIYEERKMWNSAMKH